MSPPSADQFGADPLGSGPLGADHVIVVDLGYGDAGKGTVVDWLCARRGAAPRVPRTVVRFNGGAQAAHNVVTPDGRHHTFAQFGSGMFTPGVRTHLSRFMLVDPLALASEAAHLADVGVPDALDRLSVHRDALLSTPFHRAANRARERARRAARHGGVECPRRVAGHEQVGQLGPDRGLGGFDSTALPGALDELDREGAPDVPGDQGLLDIVPICGLDPRSGQEPPQPGHEPVAALLQAGHEIAGRPARLRAGLGRRMEIDPPGRFPRGPDIVAGDRFGLGRPGRIGRGRLRGFGISRLGGIRVGRLGGIGRGRRVAPGSSSPEEHDRLSPSPRGPRRPGRLARSTPGPPAASVSAARCAGPTPAHTCPRNRPRRTAALRVPAHRAG